MRHTTPDASVAEIRGVGYSTPVVLSAESRRMWELLFAIHIAIA